MNMNDIVNIFNLEEIDLRTNKLSKINILDSLPKDLKNSLKQLESNIGIKLSIKSIIKAEEFVKTHYKNKGYDVFRMEAGRAINSYNYDVGIDNNLVSMILNYLKDNYELNKGNHFTSFSNLINSPGVPDFLVIKFNNGKIEELFFVEVKNETDSLRYSQLFWACSNNIPFRVVYCKNKKKPVKMELKVDEYG